VSSTTIAYDLSEASHVPLTIYTIIGQHVVTLVSALIASIALISKISKIVKQIGHAGNL